MQLRESGSREDLVAMLRRCKTRGDPSLRPYLNSQITVESIPTERLAPLANYVLQEQLDCLGMIQRRLLGIGVDIHDLSGRLVWTTGEEDGRICPPVVEQWEGEGLLLVDGLHRVWLARDQARPTITCVVLREVSVPLIATKTDWSTIRVLPYGTRPDSYEKRSYRFQSAASLAAAVPEIADKVNVQNFRYFLFRMLNELGSSGVRPSVQSKPNHVGDVR